MLKKMNKKGFTLAELLIVVAIIAVLVAISIPIFTSQLEKSRDAVTLSNLRAAYAQAQVAELNESDDTANKVDYAATATGSTVKVEGVVSKGTQDGLAGIEELPFGDKVKTKWEPKDSLGGTPASWDITFTYDANGAITGVDAVKSPKK